MKPQNKLSRNELSRRYPRASESFLRANSDSSEGKASKLEQGDKDESLATNEAKKEHTRRCKVLVVSIRKRLLDEDNLCEKYHVDSLRYSGLILSDAPDRTNIITTQRKCNKDEPEHIEITIEHYD